METLIAAMRNLLDRHTAREWARANDLANASTEQPATEAEEEFLQHLTALVDKRVAEALSR